MILKFKAWDKKNKKWAIDATPFHIIGEVTVFDMLNGYSIWEFNDLEIIQFTGLKDKKGVEGFHKDIVKGFGKLWTIEWQEEEARFWLAPSIGNTSSWKYMDELSRMEIIGNALENPELLI